MTYEESLAYIEGLQGRGWRLGLDRMRAFVAAAGLSDVLGGTGSPIQYLHVAGTNGKGSVTAYLQAALVAQGYRAGGYFSPYVVDPRERIQIGGEMIAKEEFAAVASELRALAESFDEEAWGGITEFEFKTAMGFLAWKRAGVEIVALEVGLGGRLDATNVVTPAACAIVSISLDHTAILGDSEGEIAREKAGILKQRVPGVVGAVSAESRETIGEVATEVKAPLWRVGEEVRVAWESGEVRVRTPRSEAVLGAGIAGGHQLHNAAVAYATLEAGGFLRDPAAAVGALAGTGLVGRAQWIGIGGRRVFVDGAHNPGSAEMLAPVLLAEDAGPWTAIVGMLGGHAPEAFFGGALRSAVGRVLAVPVENERGLAPEAVAEAARRAGVPAEVFGSLGAALAAAEGPVAVTGSFYLVGEAIRLGESGA